MNGMTWDAWAALGIVALAAVALVWQTRRPAACAKCDVAANAKRAQDAHKPARKRLDQLGIGR